MKISELLSKKFQTIASATGPHGKIDRNKANQMVDPRGYFAKNKRSIKHKDNIINK
jgi:hypothetical protein